MVRHIFHTTGNTDILTYGRNKRPGAWPPVALVAITVLVIAQRQYAQAMRAGLPGFFTALSEHTYRENSHAMCARAARFVGCGRASGGVRSPAIIIEPTYREIVPSQALCAGPAGTVRARTLIRNETDSRGTAASGGYQAKSSRGLLDLIC